MTASTALAVAGSRSHVSLRECRGLIMSYSGSGNTGGAWRNDGGVPPHAFDPWTQPELFRGVLTRRVFAFLIDLVVLSIPVILAYVFIAVFGLITLGLGWLLFWLHHLLRCIAGRAAFGDPGHARDGSGTAHLVRRARLFRPRRHAWRAVLDFGVDADAAGSVDRPVQQPPSAVARSHFGNHSYQQLGPYSGSATGANLLRHVNPFALGQPPFWQTD